MRDHIISILRDARSLQLVPSCKELADNIEVEAMAALQGGKSIVPSKLFGDIVLPQPVINHMSNGDDDTWFSLGKFLDVNVFYADGWHFGIYPISHEGTNTDHLIEKGKL